MIRRPPRSTQSRSSAASDVYKRQVCPGVFAVVDHPDDGYIKWTVVLTVHKQVMLIRLTPLHDGRWQAPRPGSLREWWAPAGSRGRALSGKRPWACVGG